MLSIKINKESLGLTDNKIVDDMVRCPITQHSYSLGDGLLTIGMVSSAINYFPYKDTTKGYLLVANIDSHNNLYCDVSALRRWSSDFKLEIYNKKVVFISNKNVPEGKAYIFDITNDALFETSIIIKNKWFEFELSKNMSKTDIKWDRVIRLSNVGKG